MEVKKKLSQSGQRKKKEKKKKKKGKVDKLLYKILYLYGSQS